LSAIFQKATQDGQKVLIVWFLIYFLLKKVFKNGELTDVAVAATDARGNESVPKRGINGQSEHGEAIVPTIRTFGEGFHVVCKICLANLTPCVFDGLHSDHGSGDCGKHGLFLL
jgi:hypothetical protein